MIVLVVEIPTGTPIIAGFSSVDAAIARAKRMAAYSTLGTRFTVFAPADCAAGPGQTSMEEVFTIQPANEENYNV